MLLLIGTIQASGRSKANGQQQHKHLIQIYAFISIVLYFCLAVQFACAQDAHQNEHLKNLAEAQRQLVQSLLGPSNATGGQNALPVGLDAAVRVPIEPSLAESTAVGTAAGLMMHDHLLGQANRLDLSASEGAADDEDNADDRPPNGMEGSDEDEQEARSLEAPPSQQMFVDEQGHLLRQPSLDVVRQQHQQHQQDHRQYELDQQEPPGEELAPDSMDSLMRAEGEMLEPSDEPEDVPAAGTNLINQQQQVARVPVVVQLNNEPRSYEDGEEEADDGLDGQFGREMGQLESHESRPDSALQVVEAAASSTGQYQPELAHLMNEQLMAPVRDSAQDLNAAAGHYYGKKKKKKVIIIKKKKKKKKKKKVYKKVKIVKVKKVKKKKKKGKKMYYGHMKKKKKGHHHDHGKYYMYAKVPKKKSWEFGFKKGNKKHWIERHEKGHKNKFKTKVKWYDKKSKGKGLHIWDYNHHDKKKKKHYR